MNRLADKVAIVTGATSGLGRGIALAFGREGATVVGAGRNADRGRTFAEEIGDRGEFVQSDLQRVDDCRALVEHAVSRHGRLDVLVNAAGIFPLLPTSDVTEELFDEALDANVKSVFFCGQAALKHMAERKSGSVINMSSVAGGFGASGCAVYCATKGAIHTLTKAWAIEYAPLGVCVNALAPGTVETPMNDHLRGDPGFHAATAGATPAGRNGRVEDIVGAAIFLASDEARWFNGAIIPVDGGWSAG
jgi:NAD(P)-dependent dehydrogenase (short-subunit alcohol dehydrogenase family)